MRRPDASLGSTLLGREKRCSSSSSSGDGPGEHDDGERLLLDDMVKMKAVARLSSGLEGLIHLQQGWSCTLRYSECPSSKAILPSQVDQQQPDEAVGSEDKVRRGLTLD